MSEKVLDLVKERGGIFGPDLCKALGIEQNRLANVLRTPLARGQVVVEKRIYPGTNRKVTYCCLPAKANPDPGPRFPEGLNTADPFGLAGRRVPVDEVAAPNDRAVKPVESPVKVVGAKSLECAPRHDEWRERALAAERHVEQLRARLTAIGVSAIQEASTAI